MLVEENTDTIYKYFLVMTCVEINSFVLKRSNIDYFPCLIVSANGMCVD